MIKRLISLLVLTCLLFSAAAIAEEKPIPARYAPVLEVFGAVDAEELYQNILAYMNEVLSEHRGNFTVERYPLKIRFGGTTEELISDRENWDFAVVSSKEVNLQVLANQKLIRNWIFVPNYEPALNHHLLPQKLQNLMPEDTTRLYDISFFDYDAQADDATLLIMNEKSRGDTLVSEAIMNKRSADQVRTMEGICRVAYWTEEELLAKPDDWDTATLRIQMPDGLKRLDEAGLLLDLSENSFLASRTTREDTQPGYLEMINGIFSADDRMIGIPTEPFQYSRDEVEVFIINAKSAYTKPALDYAVYYLKCCDWCWSPEHT